MVTVCEQESRVPAEQAATTRPSRPDDPPEGDLPAGNASKSPSPPPNPKTGGFFLNSLPTNESTEEPPLPKTTGVTYYTYRYYDPLTGRWPSRDPIQERGGLNLYGLLKNDSVGRIDYLGMEFVNEGVEYVKSFQEGYKLGHAEVRMVLVTRCFCDTDSKKWKLELMSFVLSSKVVIRTHMVGNKGTYGDGQFHYLQIPQSVLNAVLDHEELHRTHYKKFHDDSVDQIKTDFSGDFDSCKSCQDQRLEKVAHWEQMYGLLRREEEDHLHDDFGNNVSIDPGVKLSDLPDEYVGWSSDPNGYRNTRNRGYFRKHDDCK
jgi:RHS repeat-associated protein